MEKMSRRTFSLAAMGCMGAALSESARTAFANPQSSTPPNLIFLLTDDQRWDALGCIVNPIILTQNLAALAGEGVVFENAYVTTSICAASRASILSGRYVCNHGIDDFQKTFDEAAFARTYPVMLRDAGYATGFVGKYGVGDEMPESAFDYWRGFPGQGKFEQKDADGNYIHLTQVQEHQAVAFINEYGQRQPFCLSVSFKAPHVQDGDPRQFIYDPRDEDLYRDIDIPVPDNLKDTYEERFPEFFRANNEARNRWQLRFSTPELFQDMVKAYYRLITGVDRAVGKIRERLEASGLAENTVIIFTSDNGFFLGDHGLAGKWYGYEPSIRVPLLVYDPRLPKEQRGTRRTEMVLNLDMAPTLLHLGGVTIPETMQGRDITPLLRGQAPPWREDFFYEHTFDHPAIPKSEGVVSLSHKYLRYIDESPVYEELFDLRADPYEARNLVGSAEHAVLLEQMRERYRELKGSVCS